MQVKGRGRVLRNTGPLPGRVRGLLIVGVRRWVVDDAQGVEADDGALAALCCLAEIGDREGVVPLDRPVNS